jgi:G3E family GTPase
MGDKKQKKNKKQRRKAETSKRGQLPSSVQALLGYLGGGGPTPMFQQPVSLQRERAGVDSIETLSQIIRQQNLMNVSYMQNMEKLAFKNEMQEQLKKQGEEQKKELKEAREEQKQEINKVVVQTQEAAREAIQVSTERNLDQERKSVMRSLKYYKSKNKPDKVEFMQEQLRIIEGSMRNKSLNDLRSSLQYESPFAAQAPSSATLAAVDFSTPGLSNYGGTQERTGLALHNSPAVIVDPASTANIVNRLPALDPNLSLEKQLGDQERFIKKQVQRRQASANQELSANLGGFAFTDASSSSGVAGRFQTQSKLVITPEGINWY